MAGVAGFAGEGMPGDDVAILRIRTKGSSGQNRGQHHPARYARHDSTPYISEA
jgi:hypothetical protein